MSFTGFATMNVCIIPARGGSKRIPRKNIRDFCGRPMIAWSISAAVESGCFARVIVSTDDSEIADVARQWGAETPFQRPEELSGDHVATIPVIAHAINWLDSQGLPAGLTCCLYATAPFVQREMLRQGYEQLVASGADYAFSVTSFPFPIQRAIKITTRGRVEMFQPEYFNTRSQDLVEAWHDAGQFYWGQSSAWLQGKILFGSGSVPVKIPRHLVQDIDTDEDWVRAEWLFRAMHGSPAVGKQVIGH
jgi:N-acylneuraminate cytidylyltransferase